MFLFILVIFLVGLCVVWSLCRLMSRLDYSFPYAQLVVRGVQRYAEIIEYDRMISGPVALLKMVLGFVLGYYTDAFCRTLGYAWGILAIFILGLLIFFLTRPVLKFVSYGLFWLIWQCKKPF